MKFIDPIMIRCDRCEAEGSHRVSDLLGRSARCAGCGLELESHGRRMRELLDGERLFSNIVEIVIFVEQAAGRMIPDAAVLPAKTVRDLVNGIASALPGRSFDDVVKRVDTAIAEIRRQRKRPELSVIDTGPAFLDRPILEIL